MVGEVNKIIYNMLISGRGVYMPEVGSLYIERQGARKISSDKLLSPRNVVRFSLQEQAPSLVAEIVNIAGCGVEQAQDIYDRWLQKVRTDGKIVIGDIGSIQNQSFTIEQSFSSAINPKGVKTLVIRRKSNKWLYAVCAVCVVVALGICAFLMWGDSFVNPTTSKQVAVQQEVTLAADVAAQTDSLSMAAAQPEPVAKQYLYYVVMGVFSTPENADRAVEQAEKAIKDADCRVLPFKGKHMVVIFGSDNAGDCSAFARSYKDIYPDLWVTKYVE